MSLKRWTLNDLLRSRLLKARIDIGHIGPLVLVMKRAEDWKYIAKFISEKALIVRIESLP